MTARTTPQIHPGTPRRSAAGRRVGARHRRAAVLALAAMSALTAACGSDDDDGAGVAAEACDAAVAYGSAFAQAPQDPAEFGAFATETLVPIGVTFETSLDGDAADAATVMRTAFQKIADTGDPSALDDPATAAAIATVGKAVHEGCELTAVEIGAIEYAYVGAPTNLTAGRHSFALENTGVEDHEMLLLRRADGVTEDLGALLELPEDELFSKVEFTGVTFGGPGSTSYYSVDLEAGTYFLVCMIPQGEDGPPHFMGGMQATIVVA